MNSRKLGLEALAFLLVMSTIAFATTRITEEYVNTTGTMNASSFIGNLSCSYLTDNITDLCTLVDTDTQLGNTTTEILTIVDNATFHRVSGGWMGNTTTEILTIVDNGTFLTSITSWRGNTTTEILTIVDNGTFLTSISSWRGNTTTEILTIVDNGTFVTPAKDLYNTTTDILTVVDNGTFHKLSSGIDASNITSGEFADARVADDITITASGKNVTTDSGFVLDADDKWDWYGDDQDVYVGFNSTSGCYEIHNIATETVIAAC